MWSVVIHDQRGCRSTPDGQALVPALSIREQQTRKLPAAVREAFPPDRCLDATAAATVHEAMEAALALW
jgi:hypothetical protein